MSTSTINRFIQLFDASLRALGAQVPMDAVEKMAMLVHRCMDAKSRAYHTSAHALALCEGMQPRQVLAALFHDVVYVQLDGGLPRHVSPMLQSTAVHEADGWVLQHCQPADPGFLCMEVFGLVPGQVLQPFGGMNEFLSAVVGIHMLQAHLPLPDLVAVAACIEATVAFRTDGTDGSSAPDRLAWRVQTVLESHAAQSVQTPVWDSVAMTQSIVADAVALANRDVGGFAEADPAVFLSQTWLLLEESNAPLAVVGVYTLREYREALLRMQGFLQGLDPGCVYHAYADQPSAQQMAQFRAAAAANLAFSVDYLRAKIASIAIIEAFAEVTGGNAPVSMFLGDIRSDGGPPERAEAYLPDVHTPADLRADVLRVLDRGRARESSSDLTASPLTAFLYRSLGHQGTVDAFSLACRWFAGQLSANEYLRGLDRATVLALVQACARIAISRRNALETLAASL
ncbi:MAG: hypothetical protein K9K38_08115 [Rhodoferax sp.]|nr:hypothetical protein [Rhodoferax sp.]MCF8209351.1 hypothetical protein [Rhodoferax sp.]